MESGPVSNILDAKDFKGKGLRLRQRRIVRELDDVVCQMRALADESDRMLVYTPLRLRYCRLVEGALPLHQLRWRLKARGMPWIAAAQFAREARAFPAPVREGLLRYEARRLGLVFVARQLRSEWIALEDLIVQWRSACEALGHP